MSDAETFGAIVLLIVAMGLAAVVSSRVTERIKIPLPALVLIAAAVAVEIVPVAHAPDHKTVNRVADHVALVCVLFDGGMRIGWRRFRTALAPIA